MCNFCFPQRGEFMKACAQSQMENTGLGIHSSRFTHSTTSTAGWRLITGDGDVAELLEHLPIQWRVIFRSHPLQVQDKVERLEQKPQNMCSSPSSKGAPAALCAWDYTIIWSEYAPTDGDEQFLPTSSCSFKKGVVLKWKALKKKKKICREDLGGNVSSPEFQAQFWVWLAITRYFWIQRFHWKHEVGEWIAS